MSLKVEWDISGIGEITRRLRGLRKDLIRRELKPEIDSESARILGIAQDRVSVQTGQLRRNVEVIPARVRPGRDIEGGFAFKQKYASRHHEGMPARGGQVWPGGGRRKFAESAITENIGRFLRALGAAARRRLA